MSSHREAPRISQDPVADNTDVYAFVSPDAPGKVTILANYIPFEKPEGGPNFFTFGDDVLYQIKIDNNGDARPDIIFQFRFRTRVTNPNTFLYNTGPIGSLTDPNWNLRQVYSVRKIVRGDDDDDEDSKLIGKDIPSPPVRIGDARSTPNYEGLVAAAVTAGTFGDVKVFAGQREDAFHVDLGSIFDLGVLRPFQNLHLIPLGAAAGRDGLKGFNVHTIGVQVPSAMLTRDGSTPTDPSDLKSVIGVYATASRRRSNVRDDDDDDYHGGKWIQVSRLGNPLINEVIIPMGKKDRWNRRDPRGDQEFAKYYRDPELQNLLPFLYPGTVGPGPAFQNLAAFLASAAPENRPRNDLVAILLTGLTGLNFTGSRLADLLRLNMAIPPATSPSPFGVVGGDIAGFPNGRRAFGGTGGVIDDVTAIELRAIAGIPGVAPFTPDIAAGLLADGTANDSAASLLGSFPYLGHPFQGFDHDHD